MFVSEIQLVNIRSFSALNMKFTPGINLLVGPNNSGKSTVIRAVYRIQDPHCLDLSDIRSLNEYGEAYVFLQDISNTDSETIKYTNSKFNHLSYPDKGLIWYIFNENKVEKLRSEESLFVDLDKTPYSKRDNFIEDAKKDGNAKNFIPLPASETQNCFIYPCFSKRKLSSYQLQSANKDAFSISPDLQQLISRIQMLSNKSHPQHANFNNAVQDILGFDIGIISLDKGDTGVGLFVTDSETIPLEKMGEGVANILGLLVSILTRDGRLYLIEEPENDLHPGALKKLLQLIAQRADNNQFIISTHSNIVVRMLGDKASIFQFKWRAYELSETDRIPTTEVKQLPDSPEDRIQLLADLGYELLDYQLYEAYLIFEEASAEHLFKNLLMPHCFPQYTHKLRMISAAGVGNIGKRFSDLNSVFVFIHTAKIYKERAWVFADGDEPGIRHIEKLRADYKSWDPSHFQYFSKANIEEYYPTTFRDDFLNRIKLIENPDKRNTEKRKLNEDFRNWAVENPQQCKEELLVTAKELIDKLQAILNILK